VKHAVFDLSKSSGGSSAAYMRENPGEGAEGEERGEGMSFSPSGREHPLPTEGGVWRGDYTPSPENF